ncbi:dethiobiotin synthase [Kushneria aurantia]|uniref:ATP-dependent dethiobiotin synthetase BioD n=1 Tax=Kushneria aurantia TaxID=504092 RepID=A0ABV6G0B7_9GAMM|nr:dethiobiotin synthase [Kushneria aurantia]
MSRSAGFFITATDTDAGKTLIGCALLHAAAQRGLTTAAGKPVASGSAMTRAGLRNADALALQAQCRPPLPYEAINPVALAPPIAPHIAAREAGVALDVERLAAPMRALLARRAGLTLIEGAGGWRVPLNARECLSSLAIALALPVILVVGVRLGAINHARLTLEAIRRDGLPVAGWVANLIDPDMARGEDNLAALDDGLSVQGGAPCLGVVPPLATATARAAADQLDLDALLGGASNPAID